MDKMVYIGAILISLILIAGSVFFPASAVMWLASTSVAMNVARLVLIGMMIGLVVTSPPRRREFRLLLGVIGLAFGSWAVARLLSGSTQVIDALLFLAAAVSFGIAAIEAEPLPAEADATYSLWEQAIRGPTNSAELYDRLLPRQLIMIILVGWVLHNSRRHPNRQVYASSG